MKNIDESSLIDSSVIKKNKKNTDGLGGNICHIKWFPLKEKFCMADSDERWIQAYRD